MEYYYIHTFFLNFFNKKCNHCNNKIIKNKILYNTMLFCSSKCLINYFTSFNTLDE